MGKIGIIGNLEKSKIKIYIKIDQQFGKFKLK